MKIEPNGVGGAYLRDRVRTGDLIEVSSPRGSSSLASGEGPVVLLSAGIGATPVLAMLYAMSSARSMRPVLWLHAARDRKAPSVRRRGTAASSRTWRMAAALSVSASRRPPTGSERTSTSRATAQAVFEKAGLAKDADVYLCGPSGFMTEMRDGLGEVRCQTGFHSRRDLQRWGVIDAWRRRSRDQAPHRPPVDLETGLLVSFARSGIAAHWNPSAYQSLLELAEACDVPVRWACRTGVCHNCESGLVSGNVAYDPQPLDLPAQGNLLICCSRPVSDLVVDL